jgi:armadillo repeat-containing protein 8
MDVPVMMVSMLKKAKNSVIGNPTAKLALAHDEGFVATSVSP